MGARVAKRTAVDSRTSPNRRLFWTLQIGGWVLLIPVFIGFVLIIYPDLKTAAMIGVVRQAIGFGLTLGLWRVYRRWPPHGFRIARRAGWILLACIVATAADQAIASVLQHAVALAPPPELAARGAIFIRFLLYAGWSALYFTIRQELDAHAAALHLARAETAAREAELQLLRAQVNPHFLFNALNTIVAETEEHPAAVGDIARAVADYLRYSLRHGIHHAALGEELNAMSNYLSVEQAYRGRDRLDWKIEATDEARMTPAPTALVQPLVENAVKYGLRTSPRPLRLRIEASREDGALRVAVENSGAWVTRQPHGEARDSSGIGLNNLQRRLALLCGSGVRLEVTTPPGAVRIEVRVPVATPVAALAE